MPKNLPATIDARALARIQDVLRNGITVSSTEAFGTHSDAESKRQLAELHEQMGPEVFEAANTILSDPDFLASLQEDEDEDVDLDLDDDIEDHDHEPAAQRPTEASRQHTALVATVAALAPRQQGGRAVAEPTRSGNWHRFTRIVPDARAVKQLGAGLFGKFPCFAHQLGTSGHSAFDRMNVAFKVTAPANPAEAGPEGRRLLASPQYRGISRAAAQTASDVDRIAGWLRDNALRLAANKMQFMQMTGYEPEVLFAVSENESFLLVRETTQDGRAPVDMQYVYSWPGGRSYYANHPEAAVELTELMSQPDGITIDLSLRAAQRIEAQATAKARAAIPRQPAAPALPQAAPQTTLQPVQRVAEPVRRTTAAAPTPAAQEQAAPPAPKAVTPSAKKETAAPVRSGRFKPLMELQERGYERQVVTVGKAADQVRVKEHGSRFITILSGEEGKALAGARVYSVEIRDDVETPGEKIGELHASKGREGFFADLEEIKDNIPSAGMTP